MSPAPRQLPPRIGEARILPEGHVKALGSPVAIRGGTSIVQCGVDAEGNWLSVLTPGRRDELVRLPRWTGGVGGMELVVSKDERYVALVIYSGQSSQGYELFALQPTLTRIGGLPETCGHATAPVFSPAATWLVTFIDAPRLLRATGEYFETLQDDDSTDLVLVDWASLHVQRLPDPVIPSAPVGVELPLSTDLDAVLQWRTYDAVRFLSEDVVALRMPWGEDLVVPLPLSSPLTALAFPAPPRG